MSRATRGSPVSGLGAWAAPGGGPVQLVVRGGEPELAGAVAPRPGVTVSWRPSAPDGLARTLGLDPQAGAGAGVAVPIDGMDVRCGTADGGGERFAVGHVVLGARPDRLRAWHRSRVLRVRVDGRERFAGRAVAVVIANAEFLGSADVVPGAHPGDGVLEVQVYALRPGERAAMRRRLRTATHLPHPRIVTARGREVEVRAARPCPWWADGVACGRAEWIRVRVRPGAFRLAL